MKPLILVLVVALLFSACNRQADIRNEDAKAAGTEASTNTYNVDETTSNESSAGIISTYENSTEAFNETVTNAENETKNKYNSTFDSFATNTSNETANSAGFQASSNSSSLLESPVKEFIVYATDSTLSPYMMKANNGDSVRITFSVGISGVDYGGLAFKGEGWVDSGKIPAGTNKTFEFTADKSFDFVSYWPETNVAKATGKFVVQ